MAQAAGVANVTRLTTAMITLATGQSPDTIMTDGGSTPTPTALIAAETQLQTGLAATLADAGVVANFDFTAGSLATGTRSSYDRILDAVNLTTGTDNGAFVQVTPRLGDGNLYVTTGTTTGTTTAAAGASTLPVGGLGDVVHEDDVGGGSASVCADANIGFSSGVASHVRLKMGGGEMHGRVSVAGGLCQYFGQGDSSSGAT